MTTNSQIDSSTVDVQSEFSIQRIYVKDISYESPNAPEIFHTEWSPQINLDLDIDAKGLANNLHEVVLHITVTVKLQDKIAFLVEIKQAGIFMLTGFNQEELSHMLGSFCPNILFPYARELVSETVCRGGFPPLYLSPINFDAFYHEQKSKKVK
jgi:preprotein translocase subunit SecB